MIRNAAFETRIARVDMESKRMTSVAVVMLLNILIGCHLIYNLAVTAFETGIVKVEIESQNTLSW
jgi:hypothetical protein